MWLLVRLEQLECEANVRKTGADHGDHCKALASHSEWDGKPSSGFSEVVELINCILQPICTVCGCPPESSLYSDEDEAGRPDLSDSGDAGLGQVVVIRF